MPTQERNKEVTEIYLSCGLVVKMKVNEEDYENWQRGALIQNAIPYLSVDDREILISRTCGKCFDLLFPEEEED